MTIEAEALVELTIHHFRTKVDADDIEFLEKAMRLYGTLRIQENITK